MSADQFCGTIEFCMHWLTCTHTPLLSDTKDLADPVKICVDQQDPILASDYAKNTDKHEDAEARLDCEGVRGGGSSNAADFQAVQAAQMARLPLFRRSCGHKHDIEIRTPKGDSSCPLHREQHSL